MPDRNAVERTGTSERQKPWLARLYDRTKALNDVKVNAVTVIVFIGCLGAITLMAAGIGYVKSLVFRH